MSYEKAHVWAEDAVCRSGTVGFCDETILNTSGPDRRADQVCPGNKIITRRGLAEVQSVLHVPHEMVAVVRIGADAFGPGFPLQDVVVGADTRLRVSGAVARAMALPDGTVISARMAVNGTSVVQEHRLNTVLVHVRLEDPALVYASGLAVTCQTGAKP